MYAHINPQTSQLQHMRLSLVYSWVVGSVLTNRYDFPGNMSLAQHTEAVAVVVMSYTRHISIISIKLHQWLLLSKLYACSPL